MTISIAQPILQTVMFAVLLLGVLWIPETSVEPDSQFLSRKRTTELKGVAILLVIFGHIGYFLSQNHDFLFPLSTLAGTGVDMFLLLSGYGLTLSLLARAESPFAFYTRRALKLYIPLWIVLALLFSADWLFVHSGYTAIYAMRAFAGIFPSADLFFDIDSPLWYFTWIIALYTLFPLVFNRRRIYASALLILAGEYVLVFTAPYLSLGGVSHLYSLHTVAFPLGMLFAYLATQFPQIEPLLVRIRSLPIPTRTGLAVLFSAGILVLALHNTIPGFEQLASICLVILCIVLALLRKNTSFVLAQVGLYSYEIYLFHWPLLYHYDVLYKLLPAGLATFIYIGIFIAFGLALQNAAQWVTKYLVKHETSF